MASGYRFDCDIFAGDDSSMVPDVAFAPDGDTFAVTYKNANEVRLYHSESGELLRCFRNPEAQLDYPHGAVLSGRYLIISNKRNPADCPSILSVYDLEASTQQPVCRVTTPRTDFREAHSLALSGERLLVTYCGGPGALVSYPFNASTGHIGAPVAIVEDWFDDFGEPKGVAFSDDGEAVAVTFVTEKPIASSVEQKMRRALWLVQQKQGARRLLGQLTSKLRKTLKADEGSAATTITNGIARFAVDSAGVISPLPLEVVTQGRYCRLENINIVGDTCVVADPLNGVVMLYALQGGMPAAEPFQVLKEGLCFPHDAALSPDKKTLLVSNYGLKVVNEKPQWHEFASPRMDKVSVFRI